jgi:hypothetical protein
MRAYLGHNVGLLESKKVFMDEFDVADLGKGV